MIIRVFAGIVATIQTDSAFGQMLQTEAQRIIALTPFDFTVIVALGGAGGVVSYFKEQQVTEWKHIRLFGALGHVLAAQFAASIVYLFAVEFGWSEPWAFALCGLAGWMGNRALETLESLVVKRLTGVPPVKNGANE